MKKYILTVTLLASTFVYATDTKVFLAGVAAGLAVLAYGPTRNRVVLPAARRIQKTIRPVPQDKIDAANRKAAKRDKKMHRRKGDVAPNFKDNDDKQVVSPVSSLVLPKHVSLSWTPSVSPTVTNYRVYRSTPSIRPWHASAVLAASKCNPGCAYVINEPRPAASVPASYFVTALDTTTGLESVPSNAVTVMLIP